MHKIKCHCLDIVSTSCSSCSGRFLHSISHMGKDSPTLHNPTGVAVHSNGLIFVVDRSSDCVHVFNQDCTFSHSFGEQGNAKSQFNLPHSIAFDRTGNAYITESQNHCIQKFTSEGEFISVIGKRGEWSHHSLHSAITACTCSYYYRI